MMPPLQDTTEYPVVSCKRGKPIWSVRLRQGIPAVASAKEGYGG